jgi:16S rRNA (adenine1518-N6/adenine1519-N6)-dimethyltransferase
VAERVAAGPGSKTYGILSVLLSAFYNIEYLFTVHEHVFNPPPKVKSAVIRLTRNDVQQLGCDERLFVQVVKTGFNQRRKTLRNALKPLNQSLDAIPEEMLAKRAEQLSVQDFIFITNNISTENVNN